MKSIIAFCLLFTVGCAGRGELAALKSSLRISEQTIVAKQDESISILKENTTALAAIKSQVESLKASQVDSETGNVIGGDLESDPPQNADTVVNESQAASRGTQPVEVSAVELFVCSTSSCRPCKQLWRDVDNGDLDGFIVKKAEPFDGMKLYPAIRFRNPDSDTGWSVIYGYDEDTRLWLRAKLLGEKEPISSCVAIAPVTCRPVAMSHSEMKALHDRLHGGGSWTWPGDLATHLATVHGVAMSGGEQPVSGSFFPLQRQSAVVSSRSSVRSNSWGQNFFGRSRVATRQSCPSGRCP